ncbi:FAD:protein FMN transferase [uncultured Algibacter sp.]|uniref:FAD:protein FMN transferase n=1 Tax=uncultured Algibacter sp. TaxID=298659 RepID=UPI0026260C56|nr:FAD:protein FMN transferase [uncultured Algibacter sp.]
MNKILFVFFCLIFFSCKNETKQAKTLSVENTIANGLVFGTSYKVIYNSDVDFQKQFDSLFYVINKSMSTYQVNSNISKLNRNEDNNVDTHFIKVFNASKQIFEETKGAFDPTIGAVVNAWDFGPEGVIENIDSLKIDSLMTFVGFNKVLHQNNVITKPKGTFLDFNAIAKGYGVDVIGEFLESQNVENYLVEIGGEIRVKGINAAKGSFWKVGVEEPNFDKKQVILKAINLKNEAMATSGTYRKFKIDENGNRYSHIIDTKTGYPSKTNLLSISVITENCMAADAYATAFKAMGIEKVKSFLEAHPELKVYLIFENETNELQTLALNGFPK